MGSGVIGTGAGNDLGLLRRGRDFFTAEQLEKSGLCMLTVMYSHDFQAKSQPDYVKERLKLFEILKKDHLLAIYEKKGTPSNVITVRVADGKTVEGEAWKTTPYQVAADIR